MRIIIIIIAIALSFSGNLWSQDTDIDNREKFQIGVKAGLSRSNVYDAKGEEFDANAKFGLTAGAFFMIPIGKYFGVQPEVTITQKGFQGEGTLFGSRYNFKRTTTFMEIPLFLAFKPSEFITLLAGPQYSYLVRQRDVFSSSVNSVVQEQEFNQDNIRKNILGLTLGADINLRHVVIGGRIGWDVLNNKGDGTSNTPRYKNICTQITLGYKFY